VPPQVQTTSTALVVGGVGGQQRDINMVTSDVTSQEVGRARHQQHKLQEPCTFSFVDMNNDSPHSHLASSDQHQHLSPTGIGLKSLGVAMALAFASGSFSTSPCYSSCCDDYCIDSSTDWLLLGSLAYQCYFFWTAARHGIRDSVLRG